MLEISLGIPKGYLSRTLLRERMGSFKLDVLLIGSWFTAMEKRHIEPQKVSNINKSAMLATWGRHAIFFMGKVGGGISLNKFCAGVAREREVSSTGWG